MWSDFQRNVIDSYQNVRQSQDFSDVSLACDDDEELVEAHRVILAAGSTFFQQILTKPHMGHPHPLLYLAGVKRAHLESILEFLYCGQASLPRDQLNGFLETAKTLGIKGLQEEEETSEDTIKMENTVENREMSHHVQLNESISESYLEEDVNPIEENEIGNKREKSVIWSFMELTEDAARAKCKLCEKIVKTKKGSSSNLRVHIKVKHRGSEEALLLKQEKTNYIGQRKSIKTENMDESKELYQQLKLIETKMDSSLHEDMSPNKTDTHGFKTSFNEDINPIAENKGNSKTSLIWNFMEVTEDEARAKCKICGKIVLTQKGVTSNLLVHIKVAHRGSKEANLLNMQLKLRKEKKEQKLLSPPSQDQDRST